MHRYGYTIYARDMDIQYMLEIWIDSYKEQYMADHPGGRRSVVNLVN